MRTVSLVLLMSLVGCGYEFKPIEPKDKNSTSEDGTDGENTGSKKKGKPDHIITVETNVEVNGDKSKTEVICDAPIEYLVDSTKRTWEEAGINAPEGYRLITRAEFVEAYDAGAFVDYEYTYTVYWTGTQDFVSEMPLAINIGTSSHQEYGYSTKLSSLYRSDCIVK